MKLIKECQICRSNIAKYNCKICGSYVCETCFDKERGICNNCKGGKK